MLLEKIKNIFKSYPEIISLLLFILGGVVVVYLTNNLFVVFAPFIIAYLVTRMLRPLMVRIEKVIKLPRLITTLICLLLFVIVSGLIIWFFLFNIIEGIEYVSDLISENITAKNIIEWVSSIKEQLNDKAEFFNLEINFDELTTSLLDIAKNVITKLSDISLGIVMSIPGLIISFLIGSIASFYMLYDYDKLANFINKQCSPKTKQFLDVFNHNVLWSLFKMVMSYVLISFICFIELAIGFYILGIKDALFIAFIIAIIDVFPIVGSGGILVPWGIVAIVLGNPFQGIGLMVLWGVIVVVRQIIEPKIVGSQIGLHSLITVMALYVGLELMGGLGLVIGPLYVIICKKINESGLLKIYKE